MKVKKIVSKLFHRYNKVKESYLYTNVVYNAEDNFIILVSFSENYFLSAIEFLNTCSFVKNINVKYMQSSYKKSNENNIDDYYVKHYLLIGGDDSAYLELYNRIDTMDNSILDHIKSDISTHRDINKYPDVYFLFNRYVLLDANKLIFPEFDIINYDNPINSYINTLNVDYHIDDITKIKSSLPECFTGQSLLRFIYVRIDKHFKNNLYSFLDDAFNNNIEYYRKIINEIREPVLSLFIHNPIDNVLKNYVGPQYLVNDENDNAGGIDDESLDAIFKQQYDRFSAVKSDDIEYQDIDEQLASEEIYEGEDFYD